ncbi:hypothetical protein [Leisingera caerulea]|uniref:hypothetical protein n=1 Tax=Leisingera caerulea TaxID=506591 RepID=UPI0021A3F5AC|nr:hypothetical protein [Leisingera caerulea]UWQ84382.1 hypothetical protein K3726_04070 [Leisingera caerulea]
MANITLNLTLIQTERGRTEEMWLRVHMLLKGAFVGLLLVAFTSCAKPIDPTTASILSEMSKRTDTYFQFLIKSYGTKDCVYSSEESQKFWTATKGDLKVIDARFTGVDALKKIEGEYNFLKNALTKMQKTQKLFETKPTQCLDPEALVLPWLDIQSAINDLSVVSNFK